MLFSFITHTRSVWLRVGGGWVVVGVEGMEGRCCWWWEEENLVFQRILCSLHLSMHVHHHLTLTLTEHILFSGWIHAHKWFSSDTYSLASILGSLRVALERLYFATHGVGHGLCIICMAPMRMQSRLSFWSSPSSEHRSSITCSWSCLATSSNA